MLIDCPSGCVPLQQYTCLPEPEPTLEMNAKVRVSDPCPPGAMFMSQEPAERDARYAGEPLSAQTFAEHGQSHTCASADQAYDRAAYQQFGTPEAPPTFQKTSLAVRNWYKPRIPYSRYSDSANAGGAWQGNSHRDQPAWETAQPLPPGGERIAAVLMNGSSMAITERSARAHSQDTVGLGSKAVVRAGSHLGNPRTPMNYRVALAEGGLPRQHPVSALADTSPLRVGVAATLHGYNHLWRDYH